MKEKNIEYWILKKNIEYLIKILKNKLIKFTDYNYMIFRIYMIKCSSHEGAEFSWNLAYSMKSRYIPIRFI